MTPPDVLDLHSVAGELGVTYGWVQRHWRTLPGFPPPYLGAGPGQRPRWALAAVREFKAGRRWATSEPAAVAPSVLYAVSNDTAPRNREPDVDALLAAAGC